MAGHSYALIVDEKSIGTDGGTNTAASWTARDLNTIKSDPDSIVVGLSSNQFQLGKGSYIIECSAPWVRTNYTTLRLRNMTDSTTELVGSSVYWDTGTDGDGGEASLKGLITLTETKTFELQYYAETAFANTGLGRATAGSEVAIYAQVEILRLPGGDLATGGVWQYVDSKSVSGVTEVVADFGSDKNAQYQIIYDLAPDTDNTIIYAQVSDDNETSYESASYRWTISAGGSTGSGVTYGATSDSAIHIIGAGASNIATEGGVVGEMSIVDPAGSVRSKHITWAESVKFPSDNLHVQNGAAVWEGGQSALTNLKFYAATGNISGSITIYKRSLNFPSVVPVGGAVSVVEVQEVTSVSEVNFTTEIDDNGWLYEIYYDFVSTTASVYPKVRFTGNGGSSWDQGASDYSWSRVRTGFAGGHVSGNDSTANAIFSEASQTANTSGGGRISIMNIRGAGHTLMEARSITDANDYQWGGRHNTAGAHDGIQIIPSAGTFSGRFVLYKYRNHERLGDANPSVMSNLAGTAKTWTRPDGVVEITGEIVQTSLADTITASTTQTQAAATALTKTINRITTCATTDDAVKLPLAELGLQVIIINDGAQSTAVWPDVGDSVEGGAVDAVGPSLTAGSRAEFVARDATDWIRLF